MFFKKLIFKKFILLFFFFTPLFLPACSSHENDQISDQQFIELFHALEIQGIDNVKIKLPAFSSFDEPQYADFIIQKYQLWDQGVFKQIILNYKNKKKILYIQPEKWSQTLLNAQMFQINPSWKQNLFQLETDYQESLLLFLKNYDQHLFTIIQSLQQRNFDLAPNLYSQFQFPIIQVKFLLDQGSDQEIQNHIQIILRSFCRQIFKEGAENINLSLSSF